MSYGHCIKRDYAGNHAGFGVGAVFLFIGLVSLVMRNAGNLFFGLYSWGYWMFIPAFFILIGAISQISRDRRIRQDVAAVLRQGGQSRYSLDEIADEAGVRQQCLPRVLMDLRDLGWIAYNYDATADEIVVSEQIVHQQPTVYKQLPSQNELVTVQAVQKKYHFCMYCGQMLEDTTEKKFCPNCGAVVP
ncbi:MAG TPA: hypothetical protein VKM55_28500 [Candidatus Lokiarchaeia archaeon]|nr:hypothetical protein [Candidatus Lokiarchaeia archaeon]